MFKELCRRIARLLFTPFRRSYMRRNGAMPKDNRMEIPNDVLLGLARKMIQEGHTVTINVKGYSMRPFLENLRDKVLLEAITEPHVGDAVLAEICPGKYVLHRIIALEGDCVTLMGDGNVRGTEQCTRADLVGVVVQYIRPERTLLASDPVLKRRIRLWQRLLPVRRYLLFLYKALLSS